MGVIAAGLADSFDGPWALKRVCQPLASLRIFLPWRYPTDESLELVGTLLAALSTREHVGTQARSLAERVPVYLPNLPHHPGNAGTKPGPGKDLRLKLQFRPNSSLPFFRQVRPL